MLSGLTLDTAHPQEGLPGFFCLTRKEVRSSEDWGGKPQRGVTRQDAVMEERVRTRSVAWDDPSESSLKASSMDGLDFLLAIKNGQINPPPIAKLLGYSIVHVEKGYTVFELKPEECLYNPFGTVHGGISSTLLDTGMTSAIYSTLSKGFGCSTLEIKTHFIRPVTVKTFRIRCEAKAVHVGSRVATAEGRILDSEGRLYAHGTNTCLVFSAIKHRLRIRNAWFPSSI
jgi:uncharacterized protein (TIGR00369 family)